MEELFVHRIEEDKGIIYGYAADGALTLTNLETVWGIEKARTFIDNVRTTNQDCHLITRIYQFVACVNYTTKEKFEMRLYDYNKSIDLALDGYSYFQANGWNTDDLNKLVSIVADIKENKTEDAVMTIIDPKTYY